MLKHLMNTPLVQCMWRRGLAGRSIRMRVYSERIASYAKHVVYYIYNIAN